MEVGVTGVHRWRAAVLLAGFVCAAVTAAYTCRERVTFVERCLRNGNQLTGCWCTFNALQELPENYRVLATSWAHDGGVTYASQLLTLAAWEVRSHCDTDAAQCLEDWQG
jgi:hypothetical protein